MASEEYISRLVDELLAELVEGLPAVALDGPKAVGKSSTAERLAASVLHLDVEEQRDILATDPSILERSAKPLLIDEWQRVPAVWDRIRRLVDGGAAPGSFILTGSATPSEKPLHSGAGRIVSLRLRPMSLAERKISEPTVSLESLLSGDQPEIKGESGVDAVKYAHEICKTGFPGIRKVKGKFRTRLINGYLTNIVDRDFEEAGHSVRRPTVLRAWLRAYAAATSTYTSYSQILDAATAGIANKPSKNTTQAYRDVLERMWLLEPLPSWGGNNKIISLVRSPKLHLADPGLAARLLGINEDSLIMKANPDGQIITRKGTLFGALFESLVTLCIRVYCERSEANVSCLRTADQRREVDLIVERDDGRILPIEVKSAAEIDSDDVKHLLWLKKELGDQVVDMAIITTGKYAYRRQDGVAVVPLALLNE